MNVRFNIQMLLEPEPSLHSYVFLIKMEGGPFFADSLDIACQKGISKLSSSNTFQSKDIGAVLEGGKDVAVLTVPCWDSVVACDLGEGVRMT